MQKRKYMLYILLAVLVGLILLSVPYESFLNARHHLLCEELKFGMSVDDVLGVLHQNGEFTVTKAEYSGGDITLKIGFTNLASQILYGDFNLDFVKYKYVSAYRGGGDDDLGPLYESICSIDLITPSGTELPYP